MLLYLSIIAVTLLLSTFSSACDIHKASQPDTSLIFLFFARTLLLVATLYFLINSISITH